MRKALVVCSPSKSTSNSNHYIITSCKQKRKEREIASWRTRPSLGKKASNGSQAVKVNQIVFFSELLHQQKIIHKKKKDNQNPQLQSIPTQNPKFLTRTPDSGDWIGLWVAVEVGDGNWLGFCYLLLFNF